MNLSELVKVSHANARAKGFWNVRPNRFCEEAGDLMAMLMEIVEMDRNGESKDEVRRSLVTLSGRARGLSELYEHIKDEKSENEYAGRVTLVGTEVAELYRAIRRYDMEEAEEEAADVLIRMGDLLGGMGKEEEVSLIVGKKQERNAGRPELHSKKY